MALCPCLCHRFRRWRPAGLLEMRSLSAKESAGHASRRKKAQTWSFEREAMSKPPRRMSPGCYHHIATTQGKCPRTLDILAQVFRRERTLRSSPSSRSQRTKGQEAGDTSRIGDRGVTVCKKQRRNRARIRFGGNARTCRRDQVAARILQKLQFLSRKQNSSGHH